MRFSLPLRPAPLVGTRYATEREKAPRKRGAFCVSRIRKAYSSWPSAQLSISSSWSATTSPMVTGCTGWLSR